MQDFQNFLRLMVESDKPDPSASPVAPTAIKVEDAKDANAAFMAYKRELAALWQPVATLLAQADKQLEAIYTHLDAHFKPVKSQKDIAAHVATFNPTRTRPTIDRSRVQAMVDNPTTAAPPATTATPTSK